MEVAVVVVFCCEEFSLDVLCICVMNNWSIELKAYRETYNSVEYAIVRSYCKRIAQCKKNLTKIE